MIYFIGIKGTGMAALACILNDLGYEVMGSDLEKHFFTEEPLKERKIKIIPFDTERIPDNSTVIIGNAFLEDFSEVIQARNNPTLKCYRYHEFLGEFMKDYNTICVAGSHGKTTTTGMLSTMLNHSSPTGWLIGDGSGSVGKDTLNLAVEACEFRRHFLAYHPDYAIITNVEIDHVDYFKDEADYRSAYEEFSKNVKKKLIVFGDDPEVRKCNFACEYVTYGLNENNDYQAVDIEEDAKGMSYTLTYQNQALYRFHLPFVGRHLLWNSMAVVIAGIFMGMDYASIEEGLCCFHGVKRRFVVEEVDQNVFIDDYAHHPTEVSITIDAARKRYPDKKLVAIFKPHRASRVFYFRNQFAEALKKADKVYLCDFTSIDDYADGIDIDISYLSEIIPASCILPENQEGAIMLAKEAPAVFLFMSSKDIYHLAQKVKEIENKQE